VRYAIERGHKVTLFNRGKQPQESPSGVEELVGDRNVGDLKALEGRDWTFALTIPRRFRLSEAECKFPGITTIIRPGLIAGRGDETDRFTYWPVRIAREGTVLAPGDGSDPVQFIDARDLAEWTIRVAESRNFGTYNATGPAQPLTMRAMLTDIATAIGAKFEPMWVPASFLETENVSPWSDMPVWIPSGSDSAGFARRDIRRALKAGLTYRPLRVTALDTLEWFKKQPAERQAELKAGLSPSREQQVLTDWKARSG
jgi:2'-hydroxyisoflavone reductase